MYSVCSAAAGDIALLCKNYYEVTAVGDGDTTSLRVLGDIFRSQIDCPQPSMTPYLFDF